MPPKKKKENPVKQKDHRHHRPLCNWADRLYEEACDYVEINRGTDYPCEERHLKELAGNLRTHNGRFATLRHGTESLLRHLDKSREPSRREYEALDLLGGFLSQGGYGADIAIKAFVDLDHVFFRGKLHGFVTVQWVNEKEIKAIQGVDALGATSNIDEGRAWIKMSKGVFARTYDGDGVATCMWGTLLHEMLVSRKLLLKFSDLD